MYSLKSLGRRGCKNVEDYCKFYLASDVLTFLDVVCNNMDKTYVEFGLDLGHYFPTPQLEMDLRLKIGKVAKGLITDIDQHLS